MPKIRRYQAAFTAGELDPRLTGRRDTAPYYVGCATLKNVLTRPQGTAQVRPGIRHIEQFDTIPAVRLVSFVFNSEQRYLIAIGEGGANVYLPPNDARLQVIATPYQRQHLAELDFCQVADTLLIAHEAFPLGQIQRQVDGAFTYSTFVFERPPQFRYQDRLLTMFANGTTGSVGVQCLGGPIFRPGYDQTTGTGGTPTQPGEIWTFRGIPVRLDAVDEVTYNNAQVTVLGTFPSVDASTDWAEQAGQPRWGYYRSIAFYQSRLWLGGTGSAPAHLWASRTDAPFDFFATTTNDSDPLDFPVSTGRIDPIQHIVPASGGLEVYTQGDEGLVVGGIDVPITPRGVTYAPQSSFGSRKVKPVRLNNNTVFVQQHGGVLREQLYSADEETYQPQTVSIRASHIVRDPVRVVAAPGGFGLPLDFLMIVNRDGTAALMTSERPQEVAAWSQMTLGSGYLFLDLCAVGDRIYAAYRRGSNCWLGVFDATTNFDLQKTVSFPIRSTSFPGFEHLAEQTVEAFGDNRFLGPATVDAAGVLRVAAPIRFVTAGVPIDWRIRPMPAEFEQESVLGKRIRPVQAEVRFLDSAGLRVNGRPIYDRAFAEGFSEPERFSGVRRVYLRGWSTGEQCPVEITREGPYPCEIVALAVDYAIGA
jgi:hypothetical protein